MRCATCGETLGPGDERCPTCGAVVAYAMRAPATAGFPTGAPVPICPRCGYRGQGVSYFSRTGHIGLLVGVSVLTYGVGGLAYWLARRKNRICPSCGLAWERAEAALLARNSGSTSLAEASDGSLPSGGVKRRLLGSALVLFGSFLIMIGMIEAELAAAAVGSIFGAAGSGTFFWGWRGMQDRRAALQAGVQRNILRLAEQRGGSLTVTQVAADLNLSLEAAERALIAMDDGFRVRSEITDEGILLYDFPEVRHRPELGPGASPT